MGGDEGEPSEEKDMPRLRAADADMGMGAEWGIELELLRSLLLLEEDMRKTGGERRGEERETDEIAS